MFCIVYIRWGGDKSLRRLYDGGLAKSGQTRWTVNPFLRVHRFESYSPHLLLGYGQVVRHRFLVPCIAGSNPAIPADGSRWANTLAGFFCTQLLVLRSAANEMKQLVKNIIVYTLMLLVIPLVVEKFLVGSFVISYILFFFGYLIFGAVKMRLK